MTLSVLLDNCRTVPSSDEQKIPYLRILWITGSCVLALYFILAGYDENMFLAYLAIMGFLTVIVLMNYDQMKMYGKFAKWKLKHKIEKVEDTINLIGEFDKDWNRDLMMEMARDTFMEVNEAWVEKDWETLETLLNNDILVELEPLVKMMERLGQSHALEGLKVTDLRVVQLEDHMDDYKDSFTALIDFEVVEYTKNRIGLWTEPDWTSRIDPNKERERRSCREFWTFQWQSKGCKVMNIWGEAVEQAIVEDPIVLKDWRYMDLVREIEDRQKRMKD